MTFFRLETSFFKRFCNSLWWYNVKGANPSISCIQSSLLFHYNYQYDYIYTRIYGRISCGLDSSLGLISDSGSEVTRTVEAATILNTLQVISKNIKHAG